MPQIAYWAWRESRIAGAAQHAGSERPESSGAFGALARWLGSAHPARAPGSCLARRGGSPLASRDPRSALAGWLSALAEDAEARGALRDPAARPAPRGASPHLAPRARLVDAAAARCSRRARDRRALPPPGPRARRLARGRDVVLATPTASGKSLVYQLPALEARARGARGPRALLFPLRALEQDQQQKLAADSRRSLGTAACRGPRRDLRRRHPGRRAPEDPRRAAEPADHHARHAPRSACSPHHASWQALLRGPPPRRDRRAAQLPRRLRQPRGAGAAPARPRGARTTAPRPRLVSASATDREPRRARRAT